MKATGDSKMRFCFCFSLSYLLLYPVGGNPRLSMHATFHRSYRTRIVFWPDVRVGVTNVFFILSCCSCLVRSIFSMVNCAGACAGGGVGDFTERGGGMGLTSISRGHLGIESTVKDIFLSALEEYIMIAILIDKECCFHVFFCIGEHTS